MGNTKTFSMGGIHPDDKKLTADIIIESFPLVDKVYISMSQHIGAPSEPIVAVGDKVKVGQLIAKPSGFVSAAIHSSVSGTVSAIGPYKDIVGNLVNTITISVEGDVWDETINRSSQLNKDIKLSKEEILKTIADKGIVGLGGASFPTHIKLTPPPGKKAGCLIINCAECEPYITSDYRLMIEHSDEILVGASIMMKALGVDKCYLAIEDNKQSAIRVLSDKSIEYPNIKVVTLQKKYPQGGEKQLIDAVIGQKVPSKGLPIDTGAVVQNCATAFAVYEAVQKNKPLIDGVITITGDNLLNRKNLLVRVGTPIEKLIEYVGGIPDTVDKIISGGPMMGKAISNISAAVVKSSSSILMLAEEQTKRNEESNCIRCGKCIEVCPMGLEPYLLNKLSRNLDYVELENNKVYDCVECGSCMYTCPACIPLLDYIRISKSEVMKIMRSRPKK